MEAHTAMAQDLASPKLGQGKDTNALLQPVRKVVLLCLEDTSCQGPCALTPRSQENLPGWALIDKDPWLLVCVFLKLCTLFLYLCSYFNIKLREDRLGIPNLIPF